MSNARLAIILAHFLLCALGLLAICKGFTDAVVFHFLENRPLPISLYLCDFFFNPEKPFEIVRYCVSVAALGFYAAACSWLIWRREVKERIDTLLAQVRRPRLIAHFAVVACVNLALYWLSLKGPGSAPALFALGCLALPWFWVLIYPAHEEALRLLRPTRLRTKWFYATVTCLLATQFVVLLLPFIAGPVKLMNEFWSIPDYTLTRDASGTATSAGACETAKYLAEHELLGPNLGMHAAQARVSMPQTLPLRALCSSCDKVCYDAQAGQLMVLETLNSEERQELLRLTTDETVRSRLADAAAFVELSAVAAPHRDYSSDERHFIEANCFQIHWQVLNRWVIHHHNYMLGPMSEMDLGRKTDEICFQYGFLNTSLMRALCRVFGNGVSYQAYFPLYYSFYLVYFAMFAGLAWLFFRSWRVVAALLAVVVTAIALHGFDLLFLGPGSNPLRHLLDLPVAAALWFTVRAGGRRRPIWVAAAGVLAILAILGNREFGLFLALSLGATMLWDALQADGPSGRRALWIASCLAFIATAFVVFMVSRVGISGQTDYYLRGLLGFRLGETIMIMILLMAAFALLVTLLLGWRPPREARAEATMAIFFLLYSLQLAVYFIWNHTYDHLFSLMWIYAFAIAFLALVLARSCQLREATASSLIFSLLGFTLLVDVAASSRLWWEKVSFDRAFASHRVYEWPFDRAKVLSTMDPRPFAEAVELIRRHDPSDPGIHLFSRYDQILPFLTGRYSRMPFPEVGNFMITAREQNQVVEAVRHDRPEILFVDSDIEREYRADIIPEFVPYFGYLHAESLWRAERLELLRDAWRAVAADYELMEKGEVLSAYRRKGAPSDDRSGSGRR